MILFKDLQPVLLRKLSGHKRQFLNLQTQATTRTNLLDVKQLNIYVGIDASRRRFKSMSNKYQVTQV